MRQAAARTIELPLDRTWKGHVPACSELTDVWESSPVHTLRVKLVGTPRPPEVAESACQELSTTQRFASMPAPSELPRRATAAEDALAIELLRRARGPEDALEQALAFARTIPALTPEELGFSASGVREIQRLEVWLEPRDRAGTAADSCEKRASSSTLRISANPLMRACQLPASVVLCAAAMLCVLSALALGLLTN